MTKERPHHEKEPDRILVPGTPEMEQCDNKVVSARYNVYNFIFVATLEQFRRFANTYFLIVGCIMAVGYYYPTVFESAISPWTTLGPLSVVVSISLLVEGSSDYKRHKNDAETNNAPCVIVRRVEDIDKDEDAVREESVMKGKDLPVDISKAFYADALVTSRQRAAMAKTKPDTVKIGFQRLHRKDIRQGHFILIRNREMVPADIVLLASNNELGSAYIETSSIDGETNLKLRTSPRLSKHILEQLCKGMEDTPDTSGNQKGAKPPKIEQETLHAAVQRITRFSRLGRPNGKSVIDHPAHAKDAHEEAAQRPPTSTSSFSEAFVRKVRRSFSSGLEAMRRGSENQPLTGLGAADGRYVSALITEPPNPSVHTFSGKLILPPFKVESAPFEIPLGAENVLLRGAVLRNTEWAIGLAFFTGTDTKLIQNSFETPSKFSQLDRLMNYTVAAILCLMILTISYLSAQAVYNHNLRFDELWYVGFNGDVSEPWPYLPDLEPPAWKTSSNTWPQFFFLYVTLLNNFIPLSLYVTVEFISFVMLWFIYSDLEMYDATTNTRAVARSTTVTDLGQIQYIFSDKTGTLTQNVMRFKRCSVDGTAFGAPIVKAAPGADDKPKVEWLPLRHLLAGKLKMANRSSSRRRGLGGSTSFMDSEKLTFNAEMFLRVMSLCHTVVVEKDIDNKHEISSGMSAASNTSQASSLHKLKSKFMGRMRANTGESLTSPLSTVSENNVIDFGDADIGDSETSMGNRNRTSSVNSMPNTDQKGPDGAPYGFAYQAESPDEGALVSAASSTYGFQLVTRDSSGIKLRVNCPTHFGDKKMVNDLKTGKTTLQKAAAKSASFVDDKNQDSGELLSRRRTLDEDVREEIWTILAVNKFDSDRKRMSILLRSPPELGNLPILFCKGADSAMLDPNVCRSKEVLHHDSGPSTANHPGGVQRNISALTTVSEDDEDDTDDNDKTTNGIDDEGWELAQMLGIQVHLGDFASEGLRTLVLGMRILSENECESWMKNYTTASVALKNRDELMSKVALEIETDLHVVGATAIEDKLQVGVPKTIATLEKAGIKLWVLTGDKRETAVEIGYSTHVLTPKMHLTQVADNGVRYVRTQMAMEFIRLVKMGKLLNYQTRLTNENTDKTWSDRIEAWKFKFAKMIRAMRRARYACLIYIFNALGFKTKAEAKQEKLNQRTEEEKVKVSKQERRRNVRMRADKTIREWLESDEGKAQQRQRQEEPSIHDSDDGDELTLTSEETPSVFNRATSARSLLRELKDHSTKVSDAELRKLSLVALGTQNKEGGDEEPVVDEDTLSLDSFFPDNKNGMDFDKKKRTILERIFAVDKQVRKGQLKKHMTKEKLASLKSKRELSNRAFTNEKSGGPRALVIEGAALKHLLGDPDFEEILFSVASHCDAIIACRVSPKQKALLVNLVRQNVRPEPITLAIGDGANDVGMIQEAHVGIGISGKEGKQAVNASDFAIAQFRFLENLILIHGRWNFFRLSTVVFFSFYKNAIMAGILITFTARSVYSGTPLYDEWLIAMLNFVAGIPIMMTGLFDRCLSKSYVRLHPEVYTATRENELITTRSFMRWIAMVFLHVFTLYFGTVPALSQGGGVTPAWLGLLRNDDPNAPGDGEGGDLKSVGTVTFTCMVLILAYKVLFETKSLVHGHWPAFTCSKDAGEGVFSRLAYTWIGVIWLSIAFYLFAIFVYQTLGYFSANQFSGFVETASHVMAMRSLSWIMIVFVPICGIAFDVCGKVFSNMFYPTQTQIHVELEAASKIRSRRRRQATARRESQPENISREIRRSPRPPVSDTRGLKRTENV